MRRLICLSSFYEHFEELVFLIFVVVVVFWEYNMYFWGNSLKNFQESGKCIVSFSLGNSLDNFNCKSFGQISAEEKMYGLFLFKKSFGKIQGSFTFMSFTQLLYIAWHLPPPQKNIIFLFYWAFTNLDLN